MYSLKSIVTNPLIMGCLSGITAIIAFIINAKVRKQKINNSDMYKIALLGFFIGLSNTIMITLLMNKNLSADQDIFIGAPDF